MYFWLFFIKNGFDLLKEPFATLEGFRTRLPIIRYLISSNATKGVFGLYLVLVYVDIIGDFW